MGKYDDKEAVAAALEVSAISIDGRKITHQACYDATAQMAKLVAHFGSKQSKIEALKHHALYMGAGQSFLKTVVPLAESMARELQELHESVDEGEANILTSIWLAKVFIELQKGLAEYNR